MGEVHEFPLYRVIRAKLEGCSAFATDGTDGIPIIVVSDELDDDKAAMEERRVWNDWRNRLSTLSGAAIAWLCHAARAAGKHTGPTLAGASVAGLAAGAMLTLVVTNPAPPQASRPVVMRPQAQPDIEAGPLPTPVKAPLSLTPGDSPTAPGGRSGSTVQPSATGPVASALATAGVPGAGSHPLKPARTMIATDVKNALPPTVPFPSHPVQCVVQHVLPGGKVVNVTVCLR